MHARHSIYHTIGQPYFLRKSRDHAYSTQIHCGTLVVTVWGVGRGQGAQYRVEHEVRQANPAGV